MKSFWASACIFLALLGLIIWNSCYVHHACNDLIQAARAVPACEERDAQQALSELTHDWAQKSAMIELSVSRHTIHKIDDYLCEWQSALKTGDVDAYERCRHLFCATITQIARTDSVTLGNWI